MAVKYKPTMGCSASKKKNCIPYDKNNKTSLGRKLRKFYKSKTELYISVWTRGLEYKKYNRQLNFTGYKCGTYGLLKVTVRHAQAVKMSYGI